MKRLFEDLLTIEVDIVLEERDRGDEAPDADRALLEIARAYDGYLRNEAADLDARRGAGDPGAFAALRERAMRAEAAHRRLRGADRGQAVILQRIHRNCDQIVGALSRGRPFAAEDVVRIRKIWEIGVDVIVLQTVVQLDGDVVTRVSPGGPARLPALHELHQANVRAAVECWQALFALLAHVTAGTVRSYLAVVISSRRWHRKPTVGDLRTLAAACAELRDELFRRGGASVTTTYPAGAGTAIRTVIQPDGDLVCHVDCDLLPQDSALWGVHTAAVREFTAKVAGTVRRIDALLSRAGVALPVAIASVVAIGTGRAWGAVAGFAFSVAAVGAANIRDAVLTTDPDRGLLARWSALTIGCLSAGLLGVRAGGLFDLLVFALSLVPGLLVSWGLHWALRRYLGLRL
ncbi:hypothetical protein [Paractinoplanes atraurantiacus]|uniref:Uncharacterized protein n=1 Tax=Paractinoplanes atraurantiacus TaxID=1036182 RepID=A0A285JFH7_9ACTN|nr:hypothetical protein [Actinoplanes atraurantiacus]SNY59050.1 hypothetical protein SAMN05421748_12015 [Actinoplanes atraurantiacus]